MEAEPTSGHDLETRVLEALVASDGASTALELITGEVAQLFDVGSMVVVHDKARARLEVAASSGVQSEVVAALDGSSASGPGPVATAIRTGEAQWCATDAGGPSPELGVAADDGWGSVCVVPVTDRDGGAMAALVCWCADTDRRFNPSELNRVVRLTRLVVERGQQDRSMRRIERRFRIMSEMGHVGAWWIDLPGTALVWSDEVAAIHDEPPGFQPDQAAAISYYAPEHRPVIATAFAACIERGEPFDLELRITTATGRERWCRATGAAERDDRGAIVHVEGAFQDVTDTKLAEIARLESEQRYRLVTEVTSDVIFDWDLRAGRVWLGDGLEHLLGPDVDVAAIEADPLLLLESTHPEDRDRVVAAVESALRDPHGTWACEYRVLRSDGAVMEVEGCGVAIRDERGRTLRIVGALIDLTPQRALERQLAKSQHLEALGQLTGGIAHDFNNLLTVIVGNVDAMIDVADGVVRRELLEMTRQAAERGSQLTRQLLAFARRQPLEPAVVDLGELLDEFQALLGRSLPASVEVRLHHDPAVRTVMVDHAQLESAMLNIALNARDAMPDGGTLTIATSHVTRTEVPDELTAVHPATAGTSRVQTLDLVSIEVTDSGSGMPPEVADHAFEPFFTTKGPGEGSGLGLSMVYGFAEQSNGAVELESEPGRGTTVRLLLPRPDPEDTAAMVRPLQPGRPHGTERILLVEDDDLVRRMARTQLDTLGYEVVEAADGPSALERFGRDGPFALLFTDVMMPGGMDGRELAGMATAIDPGIAVLYSSGYAYETVVHEGHLDGEVDLLQKPYRLDELAARVRSALDRRGTVNPDRRA